MGDQTPHAHTHSHTHTRTETETAHAARRSLRRKHVGFPLTEATEPTEKQRGGKAAEEAATLTEPGHHGCGTPQLRSPTTIKMKKKKKKKKIESY